MNTARIESVPEEYFLGRFPFPDDTPLPLVLDTLRPAILRVILKEWYQFPELADPSEAMECEYFYIGRSQERYRGRSRLKVKYRLKKPPIRPHGHARRDVSRSRSLYCWIGASEQPLSGVSLFFGRDRPPHR